MRNNKKRGFTLVELLVVIAILAILATVSVVGYTSFIERANMSVDEQLVTQLNNFLVAYKADHTNPYANVTIDENNAWEVANDIINLGGLDKLSPQAKGYHFYFDITNQEFVHKKESELTKAGWASLIDLLASAGGTEDVKAGFFLDADGNKYFLVDKDDSALSVAVRGFYTLEGIEGEGAKAKFETFLTAIDNVSNEQWKSDLQKLANTTVFATSEGNFVVDLDKTHTNLAIHKEATYIDNKKLEVVDGEIKDSVLLSEEVSLITVSQNTTIVIPKGIMLPTYSMNVKVADGYNANVTIVIQAKNWDEVVNLVDANFTYNTVVVELAGVKHEIYANDVCAYTADDTKGEVVYTLKYNNSLQNFELEIIDNNDNQVVNGSKLVNGETIKAGYAAWDKGSFKLQVTNAEGKKDSAISTLAVKWEVVSGPATIAQDGTVTFTGDYELTHDNVVVKATSLVDREGYTSTSNLYDETNVAEATYTIYIAGPKGYTVTADGANKAPVDASLTNREYNITLVQTQDGSQTFAFNHSFNDNDNVISGITLNYAEPTYTYTCNCGKDKEHKVPEIANGTITTYGECSGTITVTVDKYVTYTVNLTVQDSTSFLVQPKNSNIFVGNLNGIKLSDLFKTKDGSAFPANAELRVYNSVVTNGANADTFMKPNRTPMPTSEEDADGIWVTNNVAGLNETIQFKGDTTTLDVTFAVFLDGVRISADVIATEVVEGYNVDEYSDIAEAETAQASIILLNDITVATNNAAIERIDVASGKTLYGNFYTIKLPTTTGEFKRDYAYIKLNGATMRDTKVVGDVYETLSLTAQDNNGMGTNAVWATAKSRIENCYIANTRSPLVAGADTDDNAAEGYQSVVVANTVLFGGRYANVDLRGGTLRFEGNVITVNQAYEDVVGIGISVWIDAPANTKIEIADGATWTPYNFIARDEAHILPEHFEIETNMSGTDIAIGLPMAKMFLSLFGDCVKDHTCPGGRWDPCCSNVLHGLTGKVGGRDISALLSLVHLTGHKLEDKYNSFIFEDDKEYINAAAISMNNSAVNVSTTNTAQYASTTYSMNLYFLTFNVDVLTLKQQDDNGNKVQSNYDILTASQNAVTNYNPDNYVFVNGVLTTVISK